MKVFVSDLDRPIGNAVSNLLYSTVVGSRKDKDAQNTERYDIYGTVSKNELVKKKSFYGVEEEATILSDGEMKEINDQLLRKLQPRKSQKIPTIGYAPSWIKSEKVFEVT